MKPQPFNDSLHAIISGALDRTEEKMIGNGVCQAEQADEYLTARYIEACAGILVGGLVYLTNDERIGAEIFLSKLGDAKFNRLSERRKRECAVHLTNHTHVYFPQYHMMLRLACLHVLRTKTGYDYIEHDGVILLAAATLPGVRSDIRRELRRRGASFDRLLVPDDIYKHRMSQRILPSIM
ncbi:MULTISPECIES: hypothetical protein [unclassified Sphingobium]|uniref:hypothetical protein n=1 Tax=unclassified Sphingobium TaxID=2611147 RepID=UPI0035A5A090